jgi:betaine reductase
MVGKVRVMHYLNQFFAGRGGEDKASLPFEPLKGAIGPGKRLQEMLGDSAEIVVTAYCGDNYFNEHRDEVLPAILKVVKDERVQMVFSGPAFDAGRYGVACVEVCHFMATEANLRCITSMFPENPGVAIYKQYKDRRVFLFPSKPNTSGMEEALSKMGQCASKLASGTAVGSASEEGYVPRGIRANKVVSRSGVDRAVDMLMDKIAGRPFTTEIPVESLERIPVPPRLTDLRQVCLALATTSGVMPPGNPDGFKVYRNTQWRKYPIRSLNSMKDGNWDVIHGGFHTAFMLGNPNYGVPLDVCRDLEKDGVIGRLYPFYYVTSGCSGLITSMKAIGKEIAYDMKAGGVGAALMVST